MLLAHKHNARVEVRATPIGRDLNAVYEKELFYLCTGLWPAFFRGGQDACITILVELFLRGSLERSGTRVRFMRITRGPAGRRQNTAGGVNLPMNRNRPLVMEGANPSAVRFACLHFGRLRLDRGWDSPC